MIFTCRRILVLPRLQKKMDPSPIDPNSTPYLQSPHSTNSEADYSKYLYFQRGIPPFVNIQRYFCVPKIRIKNKNHSRSNLAIVEGLLLPQRTNQIDMEGSILEKVDFSNEGRFNTIDSLFLCSLNQEEIKSDNLLYFSLKSETPW